MMIDVLYNFAFANAAVCCPAVSDALLSRLAIKPATPPATAAPPCTMPPMIETPQPPIAALCPAENNHGVPHTA
jgi:hypothetical protein